MAADEIDRYLTSMLALTDEQRATFESLRERALLARAELTDRLHQLKLEAQAVAFELQVVEGHLTTFDRLLRDGDDSLAPIRPIESAGAPPDAAPSLGGRTRVQAILELLAAAGPHGMHRHQIWTALRARGFPDETLSDTSAGLAYLKRTRRVDNPLRGYWCVRTPSALAN